MRGILIVSVAILLAACGSTTATGHRGVTPSTTSTLPAAAITSTSASSTSTTLTASSLASDEVPPTSTQTPTSSAPEVLSPEEAWDLHLWSGTVTFDATQSLPLGDSTVVHATIRNVSDSVFSLAHPDVAHFALDCQNGVLAQDPFDIGADASGEAFVDADAPPLGPGEAATLTDTITGNALGRMTCGIILKGSLHLGGYGPIDPHAPATATIQIIAAPTTTQSSPGPTTA